MQNQEFEGWFNVQTFCVAAFLNNEKVTQDRALDVCEGINPAFVPAVMATMCESMQERIVNFMPEVWEGGYNNKSVCWDEIAQHFCEKLRELKIHKTKEEGI